MIAATGAALSAACPAMSADGPAGIGAALRAVDCQTGQATAAAFSRIFGTDGHLLTALTMLLTIYVAITAIGLLTGRTRMGLATLTPRMLTLGLVLTFATSWAAYQATVWNLAVGAPDQIAGTLIGAHGSATTLFADRLDTLFNAVAEAARQASVPAPPTETGVTPAAATVGGFSTSTVLWISALMLLIGTVCVLLTAKIALAALLAIGPVFIVLALFAGTRGLFEGWLKATLLFALVPLLTVLIGGGALAMIAPLVRGIALAGGTLDAQPVGALFVAATVYLALMVIVLKTAATMIAGWRVPFGVGAPRDEQRGARAVAAAVQAAAVMRLDNGATAIAGGAARAGDERVREVVAAIAANDTRGAAPAAGAGRRVADVSRALAAPIAPADVLDHRLRGVSARPRTGGMPAKGRIS